MVSDEEKTHWFDSRVRTFPKVDFRGVFDNYFGRCMIVVPFYHSIS
jgi:hypothetical protein